MKNDFDSEIRVSTDGVNNGRDEEEIRVFSGGTQINDIDNSRVCLNGDSADSMKIEDSPMDDDDDSDSDSDSDSDIEIDFRVQERENVDVRNGVVTSELGIIISGSDDRIGERENLGTSSDLHMNGIDGEFRLKRSDDLHASLSGNVSGSDGNSVTKAGNVKVLGSQFEIGEMVWAKVKSHPWWPGHIYNEAFASSSVRRSRRDGHVLVAFFGDSSYGWFDLTELIPYEPHFTEKSQQIVSKSFVRAVEESIDEASRRSALGLSCRCRNLHNFRPTSVPGYMAVDIVDYDPGAIYSVNQIQKARESFHPAEALSFVKQLGVAPRSSNSKSLDFIKHKATALAYRRSIFEEFDETYAQAFGELPERPSQLPPELIDKRRSRAALSGPLVFAEALGGRKSSTKAAKSKGPSKKDKYLFKRRDEADEMGTTYISQVHASSSMFSAYEDGTSDSAAASYVFQKRDHSLLLKDEMAGTPAKDAPTPGLDVTISMDASGERVLLNSTRYSLQSESSKVVATKLIAVQGQVPESDQMKKKNKKAVKRSAGEGNPEKTDLSEKKKRKKRKIEESEVYEAKPAARSMQIGISSGEENLEVCHSKNETQVSNSLPQQMGSASLDEPDGELPQMLADLRGLSVNPLHCADGNRPPIVRQFFLKFRSLIFLKSSTTTPLAESPEESSKNIPPPLKASKLSARQEDPTKGGRKRVPPERQEEVAAKRAKQITEVKSLGTEKRAPPLVKNPDIQRPLKSLKGGQQPMKKRMDRLPRVEEPTYLVMKFPSGSSLPSLVELKARFARFGPLDTSLIRVFYKTNTCRVAFLYKQDAHMAHRYAVGSKSVFSNVNFMLKPVAPPEIQQPGSVPRASDLPGELPSNREATRQSPVPLKSCLKKPSGRDETEGPTKANRVRFNLGEERGVGPVGGGTSSNSSSNSGVEGQQVVESRNALKSSSTEGCPSLSSCSSTVGMDVITSKNQRFIISSHPMQLPPPQFHRPPKELASRSNINYYNVTSTSGLSPGLPPPGTKDISQQMMSLLTRCHDVVANVKSVLGYVPYHP